MPQQACPACGVLHDVGIFVSGQRVRCSACGLPFTVQRDDSQVVDPAALEPPGDRPPRLAAEAIPKAPPSDSDTQAGQPGLVIPGYQLFEMLGKGGMGRVYRANQLSLDRVVAIKILSEDLAKHKSFIRRFEKESGALAALSHPNITAVIDRGHVGDTYYFVMEYAGGVSLRHKVSRARLKLDQMIDIAVVLCRAVGHAHDRGVIHRDLKPENVLFTPDDVLKVADFGLANIVGPDKRWELTRTKVSMGTVNYMAPEQRRDAKHVDHRADIYSLGVILYEMLVGELPLGRFDPPSRRCKGVDQRMDRLVLKMLDFKPDRRPQRAGLVAASLESIFGNRTFGRQRRQAARAERQVLDSWDPEPSGQEQAEEPEPPRDAPGEAISTQMSDKGPDGPGESPGRARRRRRRMTRTVLAVAGGLVLTAAAAVAVATFLLRSDLADQPGDLVLVESEDGLRVKHLQHRRVIKHQAPAHAGEKNGLRTVRFDFEHSTLPAEQVAFFGGNWEVDNGQLVQDTCRTRFTINQVPPRAMFGGAPVKLQGGVEVRVVLDARQPVVPSGAGPPIGMEAYMQNHLGASRVLLPDRLEHTVGLGFMTRGGVGLEVLLPVGDEGGQGFLLRHGEEMEGGAVRFPAGPAGPAPGRQTELALVLSEGRVQLRAGEQVLIDELAGFPLHFAGHPLVACQNLVCRIDRFEYSHQAANQ